MNNRKLIAIAIFLGVGYLLFNLLPYVVMFAGNVIYLIIFVLLLVLLIYGAYRLFKWGFSKKN